MRPWRQLIGPFFDVAIPVTFLLAMVAVLIGLTLILFGGRGNERIDSFARHCVLAGGHVYRPDQTSWCIKDGLLLEIYP